MEFALWLTLGGSLLVLMALGGSMLSRLPVSTSMLYLLAGLAVGPLGLVLAAPGIFADAKLIEHLTEIIVLLSLFTSGLKMSGGWRERRWFPPLRLALLSMLATVALITAAGVWLLGLPTYRAHRMPIGATRRWPTALENGRVRAAVAVWPLYIGTGHWLGDFLIARMNGSGRPETAGSPDCSLQNGRSDLDLERQQGGVDFAYRSCRPRRAFICRGTALAERVGVAAADKRRWTKPPLLRWCAGLLGNVSFRRCRRGRCEAPVRPGFSLREG